MTANKKTLSVGCENHVDNKIIVNITIVLKPFEKSNLTSSCLGSTKTLQYSYLNHHRCKYIK